MNTPFSPPARNRKPRGQGAFRRGEILAVATRIFLEEGVAHATMRRIAAGVGVSPTALYVYFPDKDAILAAIAEAWFAELLAMLEASQISHATVEARFRMGVRAYIEFGLARPDAYRLIFFARPARRGEADPCGTIPEADHSFAILQRCVEDMIDVGRFRPAPSAAMAETVWAAMHGITILLLDQCDHLASPPEQLIDMMIGMIMNGFR
jgi:AcrR family transcriptional regulator